MSNIDKKYSAFIVSKPLQYINATNIEDSNYKECLLVDNFNRCDLFKNVIENSNIWEKVIIFSSRYKALLYVLGNKSKFDNIYIDSDHGIKLIFYLWLIKPICIYTYEEGYGSYRKLNYPSNFKNIFKNFVYRFFNSNNWIGGSCFTDGIYLYHPSLFKRMIGIEAKDKNLFCFKATFIDHIKSLHELDSFYGHCFDLSIFVHKKVVIYFTSWEINSKYKAIVSLYSGIEYLKCVKFHPNIKSAILMKNSFDYSIPSEIPAEFFIMKLADCCDELIIIHEDSSFFMYLPISDRITEFNISDYSSHNQYMMIRHYLE